MKKILGFITVLTVCVAGFCAGGDTLNYSTAVRALADGDTFYADKHWGSLRDTTWRVINGRMGNINLAANANIALTKMDSTGTSKANLFKGDSLRLSSRAEVDSVFSTRGINALLFRGPVIGAVTGNVTGNQSGGSVSATTITASGKIVATDSICGAYARIGAGAPKIAFKKLTGTTASTEGGVVIIAHGLTFSKILSVQATVRTTSPLSVLPGTSTTPGYLYNVYTFTGDIEVRNDATSSESILSFPITILITYEE